MKQTLYILLLFCLWGVKANSTPSIDSLRYIIQHKKGQEKLKALSHIADMTNGVEKMNAATELRKEAELQSSPLFLAYADQQAAYYCNEFQNFDSVKWYIDRGISELAKVNVSKNGHKEDWEFYNSITFSLNISLVKYYIVTNKHYLALNHIQQLLEENKEEKNEIQESGIYLLMGIVYSAINQPEESLKCVTKSASLALNKDDKKHILWMLESYKQLKKYDEILVLGDSIIKQVKEKNPISNLKYTLVPIYYHTAYASIQKGFLAQARMYLDKIYEETEDLTDETINHYLEAEYYYKAQDYSKSLSNINAALSLNDQPILNRISLMQTKAKILRALGKGNDAYDQLEKVHLKSDSMNAQRFATQISEFETIHRTNNLKSDLALNKEKLHTSRILLGGSILVTLLVIVVGIAVWRGNKKLRERNRDLYKRHQKLEELTQEIGKIQLEQTLEEDELDASDIIMSKLDSFMKESKDYLKPEITRDDLALEIGTNRQYLIAAIKDKRDQTFNEYIYLWRLKYAYNLLIHNKDVPISEIFLESGFSSQSVFNKEFKKLYAMTPSELRIAAREEEEVLAIH